jgi:hypothetical protein
LCTPEKTSWSVTHSEIAPGQARLTPEFFASGLLEKKVYLGGMSILSILLSLEPGCHSMSVNEYLNSFIQLSRYAPDDINMDEKKHDVFLNGLNDDIQF